MSSDRDVKELNVSDTAQNVLTNFQESFLSGEVQEETRQPQKSTPILNSSSLSSAQSAPPPPSPPSSFFLRFAKRVAICTAVVALARYAYPKLLVLG